MKFTHSFKNYAVLCAGMIIVLLGVYGILILTDTISNSTPKPITVSSVVNCSFPDKSFCATDQLMRGYVSSKDFSDILENQTPVNVSCASKTNAASYCNGSQSNLVVQLFKVQKNTTPILYTRNQYIDFFHNYFQQEGPFIFEQESESGSTVTMSYVTSNHEAGYSLHFVKQNSNWQLSYAAISNV